MKLTYVTLPSKKTIFWYKAIPYIGLIAFWALCLFLWLLLYKVIA